MKVNIKDLREKYLETKAHEKGWIWTYYIRRPISFYIALFFLLLDISANKVTIFFLFIGSLGSLLLALEDYIMRIIGALLIEIAIILDCVDGTIARVKGPTILGKLLDVWSGEIVMVLSVSMLGFGLASKDNLITIDILNKVIHSIDNDIFLYIGIITAFAIILSWAARYSWRVISSNLDDLKPVPNKNIIIRIIENIFHYSGAYSITMLISVILNIADLFLLSAALVYITSLFTIIYTIVKKASVMK